MFGANIQKTWLSNIRCIKNGKKNAVTLSYDDGMLFDRNNNWELIEEFGKMIGGRDDIWYATNIEICEYIKAQKSLIISVDNKYVYNPSAQEVWFTESDTGKVYSVKTGETLIRGNSIWNCMKK